MFPSHDHKDKALDINDFPNYLSTRTSLRSLSPQIYALADLVGTDPSSGSETFNTLKERYDTTMQQFYKDFSGMIGENEYGWRTGAVHDLVTPIMFEYGVMQGDQFVPYDAIDNSSFVEGLLGLDDEQMQLGITYDQYLNIKNGTPEQARVIVLDPLVYGGTFNNPPRS